MTDTKHTDLLNENELRLLIAEVSTDQSYLFARIEVLIKSEVNHGCERLKKVNAELLEALQQFVNGAETGMIDSPADETLANITHRAISAIAKAKGESK